MSERIATSHTESIRHRVYTVLEGGRGGGFWGTAVEAGLVFLIVTNVAAYVLQSVPDYAHGHARFFAVFEFISVALFTIEYALRLWSAPEDPLVDETRPLGGRLHYALQPLMLIDFFAIAPAYVQLFVPFFDLRILRLIRLLRLLKIARYSPALSTLGHVLKAERRALLGTLLLLLCSVVFAGAAMHAAEGSVQPEKFGTVPNAMWWAMSTLTTVGYGDAVPVTLAGRMVASATMIVGLGIYALPVGIIATGFVQEIHRRDFVITFTMLSRVPLFKDFDARA
ncbi:MAG TPA: ion transporter, partial [Rhizomicrobium sp.]|nr:ion transporter [Rhizomicrobium sp.]